MVESGVRDDQGQLRGRAWYVGGNGWVKGVVKGVRGQGVVRGRP